MATNEQPITNATIEIYRAEDYGVTGPITTADPKSSPGYYKAEDLEDGDYIYKVSAPDKGSVVGSFNLPGYLSAGDLQKNLSPITLVNGADLNITVYDKDGKVIIREGAGGPTGPEGVTGVTGELDIHAAKLIAEGGEEGIYTVDAVPVGQRLIEIIPIDPDEYQNLKILRTISSPTTNVTINLYPPVTLFITPKFANGNIDTNGRLFEVSQSGNKIREITTKIGQDFKITHLADGVVYFRSYGIDGTTPVSDIVSYTISYLISGASMFALITNQAR